MSPVARIRNDLDLFRKSAPGVRFIEFNRRFRVETPSWARPFFILLAVLSFAIGVILAFIPGPAVVFFALTGALLAGQSERLAKKLDRAEVGFREWLESHRHRPAKSGR
jgi:hypothetical protein